MIRYEPKSRTTYSRRIYGKIATGTHQTLLVVGPIETKLRPVFFNRLNDSKGQKAIVGKTMNANAGIWRSVIKEKIKQIRTAIRYDSGRSTVLELNNGVRISVGSV